MGGGLREKIFILSLISLIFYSSCVECFQLKRSNNENRLGFFQHQLPLYERYTRVRNNKIDNEAFRNSSINEGSINKQPPPSEAYKRFIFEHGGDRVLKRILIANNGMAATKAILSLRQWAFSMFGDERILEFIVMATPDDLKANAEFIRLSDEIEEVPGGPNRNNYANVSLIVQIAKERKVDAVWPGWGHASENPQLPSQLEKIGIEFIGPNQNVMLGLGDKVAANILAQTAGVPSIPWSGDGLVINKEIINRESINKESNPSDASIIPKHLYEQATITKVEEIKKLGKKIGYPIMIKASEGGGGKGIRLCNNENEIENAFEQVQKEVSGSPIFVMKVCKNARHIEVQILGDKYNQAVALNGRDCTTQRRFQKIFEEAPPTVKVPINTFREMELAAQRLTMSLGYKGAGTVEYLYNPIDDKFFFLELNPRLQVEHPVTEGITDINLPAAQLMVTSGIPLYQIPEIRNLYNKSLNDKLSKINFMKEKYRPINKHVIAARITAENPDEGFKPTAGSIERIEFQSTPNVWGYFSIGANGSVHEYADSQIGHIFANGNTREEARKNLIMALKRLDVRGDVRTPINYLTQLLTSSNFIDNTIDTSWLDNLIKQKSFYFNKKLTTKEIVIAGMLSRALRDLEKTHITVIDRIQRGYQYIKELENLHESKQVLTYNNVKYTGNILRLSPEVFSVQIGREEPIIISVRQQTDSNIIATWGDSCRTFSSREEPLGLRLTVNGTTIQIPNVQNPNELRCDVNGKLVRYLIEDDQILKKNQAYAEVEAMKMIMTLTSKEEGIFTKSKTAGSVITAGDLLGTLKLKDPSKVTKISLYRDGDIDLTMEQQLKLNDLKETEIMSRLIAHMSGYPNPFHELLQLLLTKNISHDKDKLSNFLLDLLKQYLSTETHFFSKTSTADLHREFKDNTTELLKLLSAHAQLQIRSKLVLEILRTVDSFRNRFGDYSMNTSFKECLTKLSILKGKTDYNEIALEAARILKEYSVLPFEERCAELKKQLITAKDKNTLNKIAEDPALCAGLDMLSSLFTDPSVQDKALEVYIRRVYRAHRISHVEIQQENNDLRTVTWSYKNSNTPYNETPIRKGVLAIVPNTKLFEENIQTYLSKLEKSNSPEPVNTLHIVLTSPSLKKRDSNTDSSTDEQETNLINDIEKMCYKNKKKLDELSVRLVNVLVPAAPGPPRYYSFPSKTGFIENRLRRDMRPTYPALVELESLQENFDLKRLPSINPNTNVFFGVQKEQKNLKKGEKPLMTIFVRCINHDSRVLETTEVHRLFSNLLDELERARMNNDVSTLANGRIFVHVIPPVHTSIESLVSHCQNVVIDLRSVYAERLLDLNVDQVELKVHIAPEKENLEKNSQKNEQKNEEKNLEKNEGQGHNEGQHNNAHNRVIRLSATSEGGSWLHTEASEEISNKITGEPYEYKSIIDGRQKTKNVVYPVFDKMALKRTAARRAGTTYIYDLIGLLDVALRNSWQQAHAAKILDDDDDNPITLPEPLFKAQELLMSDNKDDPLILHDGINVGSNTIGMVGWLLTLKTPEFPEGRQVVVIGNDITYKGGSFGVIEDEYFAKVSEYARKRHLPRIYISCNSGARLGMCEELKNKIKIEWNNPLQPELGFKYLYITEKEALTLPDGLFKGKLQHVKTMDENGNVSSIDEKRIILESITGAKGEYIGVENLRGSGQIAGETSKAYDESFTLSYVTGRSVGIGAYLVRLGQRTIQKADSPIILTGFQALNKLLGKNVYNSLDQLGGPTVMYENGVSHIVVSNDKEGMQEIIDWLKYIPKNTNEIWNGKHILFDDIITRDVEYEPSKYSPAVTNVRNLLCGTYNEKENKWISGFLDNQSFRESLGGWGKSVVTGRGKLGGIPIGIIAVETRQTEARIPADPASENSREYIFQKAGQVWFPESAYKTAQAINDFGHGENLPLFIFANWRGFSGGTRDMYNEILKFGSMIVDALRKYQFPIFVYIPPLGELRGGAWVVIDPTINADYMELYADKTSRGGILEPSGICEIMFRKNDQINLMHLNDPTLKMLDKQLSNTPVNNTIERTQLEKEISKRENDLLPIYLQVAHQYADLHDRTGRMLHVGAIRKEVDWKDSRRFFYWRLRARLEEDRIVKTMQAIEPNKTLSELRRNLLNFVGDEATRGDRPYVEYLVSDEGRKKINTFVEMFRKTHREKILKEKLTEMSAQEQKEFANMFFTENSAQFSR